MKIMTITDSPFLHTGLGRVHRRLIDEFSTTHEVVPCCWFLYDTDTLREIEKTKSCPEVFYESNGKKIRLTGVPKKNGNNCMFAVYDMIDLHKPDVVVTIGDYWDFWYMPSIKNKKDYSFKWVPYLTIEHDDFNDKIFCVLKSADAIAVPSLFGKAALDKALDTSCTYVPYGIDSVFRPLGTEERAAARKKRGCGDEFRFVTVAQNTWRKNLPATLQAMKVLADMGKADGIRLHVHTNVHATDPQEPYMFDLKTLAVKLGVSDFVTFPGDDRSCCVFDAPPDEFMRQEYCSADAFLLASTCEGFGLPLVEAMACGLPVVANGTSTIPEHLSTSLGVGERGVVVRGETQVCPPSRLVTMASPSSLAGGMLHMASMRDKMYPLFEGMSNACMEYAHRLTWKKAGEELVSLFEGTMGRASIPVEEL